MIDAESAIYSTISGVFKEHYPNGSQYGEEVDSPAKFPCMVLIESDNYTHEESLNSEMREHNANLMYTLDIYSNKTSGAKQECKKILGLLDQEMQNLGFVRTTCLPTRNQDRKIYRITARYRAVISEEYRIYRK